MASLETCARPTSARRQILSVSECVWSETAEDRVFVRFARRCRRRVDDDDDDGDGKRDGRGPVWEIYHWSGGKQTEQKSSSGDVFFGLCMSPHEFSPSPLGQRTLSASTAAVGERHGRERKSSQLAAAVLTLASSAATTGSRGARRKKATSSGSRCWRGVSSSRQAVEWGRGTDRRRRWSLLFFGGSQSSCASERGQTRGGWY